METKFNNFLKLYETISSVVYHFLYPNKLKSILTSNKINLSTGLGTNADDINSKGLFFLSLSRTKSIKIGYGKSLSGGKNEIARIKFNGTKLNQKFKGSSVDYWQRKDIEKMRPHYTNVDDLMDRYLSDTEHEDRLFSNKESIENISNYIEKIDILYPEDNNNLDDMRDIINLSNKLNININVYRTYNDFEKENNNTINNEILKSNFIDSDKYIRNNSLDKYFLRSTFAIVLFDKKYFQDYNLLKKDCKELFNEYFKNTEYELTDNDLSNIFDCMDKMTYGDVNISDTISSIQNNIHNLSKMGEDSINRIFFKILAKDLKKFNCKKLKQLVNLKVLGLKPIVTNNNYSDKYKLLYTENEDEDEELPFNKYFNNQLTLSFNHYSNIYFREQENNDMITLQLEKTVGDVINYLLNHFTLKKVQDLVDKASDNRLKLIKR